MNMVDEILIKDIVSNHKEYTELCGKLVDYAKLHNLSNSFVYNGVAWDAFSVDRNGYERGLKDGITSQKDIMRGKLGLD